MSVISCEIEMLHPGQQANTQWTGIESSIFPKCRVELYIQLILQACTDLHISTIPYSSLDKYHYMSLFFELN